MTALQAAERLANGDSVLRGDATWYLALAYHRTGQLEQAKDRLEVLCRGQGNRVARACAGVRELSGPVTLSGVVTGPGGVPLAGVRVAELQVDMRPDRIVAYPTEVSVTTDAAGHYSITDVRTQALEVYKAGYFSTRKVITTITQDTRVDLSMDPWEFISLGEVVRRTIKPGDTTCGDPDELCHRFALSVPSDGTLEVGTRLFLPGDLPPAYPADRRPAKLGSARRDAAGGRVRSAAGHEFSYAAVDPGATRGDVSDPGPQLRGPRPRIRAADATALTRKR